MYMGLPRPTTLPYSESFFYNGFRHSLRTTYMTPYSEDQTTGMQRGKMLGKGFLQCLKAFPTVIFVLNWLLYVAFSFNFALYVLKCWPSRQ